MARTSAFSSLKKLLPGTFQVFNNQMKSRDPGAVIYDMDGVLVDSEPRHERAYLDVVKAIGYEKTHGLRFADFIGRSDKDLWTAFIRHNQPSQTLQELLAMKRARTIEILQREKPIFDGVTELVRKTAALCPLAVASGSDREIVETVLSLKGLRPSFSVVVSSSDVQHGKPAPDIFLRAAELLKVSPAQCWVIEDSKPGVAAGKAAGMRVIAITNTYPAAELEHADHVVSSYGEIEVLLSHVPCRT